MTTTQTPRRALVLGASMAGLLTARVLSNHLPPGWRRHLVGLWTAHSEGGQPPAG